MTGAVPTGPVLGGALVDLGDTQPKAVRRYLDDLREVLGPEVPVDLWWRGGELEQLPAGMRQLRGASSARALARSGTQAAGRGHFLALLAPLLPESAAIQGLLEAFAMDELVGFTQPRFADRTGDGIWFLPNGTERSGGSLPRQALSLLPDHYLTTERLAACVAIRREVASGFSASSVDSHNLSAALLEELAQARRRGYRNLVLNRVVVASPGLPEMVYPALDPASRGDLHARFPDAYAAEEWFNGAVHQRRERLAAKARRARSSATVPVLLDCRGAPAYHNGTSQAVLGMLDGLVAAAPRWEVDLLFNPEATRYHRIDRRYPAMHVRTALPDRSYAAAICLNQPWNISTVKELHRRGLAIAFNMLDTIAWDVVYLGNPEMAETWHFIAEHADGLSYISDFTRERFRFRFPVAPGVAETVTHLSLDPDENRDPSAPALPIEDSILVFGNNYDHKALAPTIDLLTRAFPFRQIRAMGAGSEQRHNVTVIPSGHLSEAEVDRLIATARVVVFPSYYEGFGLPVVKALAYGRTVVVRSSSLWREIAGLTRMPGRLVEFVAPHELVEIVGRVLADEPVEALPFGATLLDGGAPPRWRDCAGRLVDLVEEMVAGAQPDRWYARDRALGLVAR